jgi:hypothetical protein
MKFTLFFEDLFLIGGQKEGFWFSLACGAIGGLIFSVLAIVVWVPLFMNLLVTQRCTEKILE